MLHKQKYFCQICEKACKDENGFKVHCKTPGHISKIKTLSEDSDFYINSYSRQFEDQFLRFLRLKGMSGDTFCSSNLYQDFIKEIPNHIHLNATRWTKLTNFLYNLEAKGYLKIQGFSDYGKSTIKLTEKLVGNNNFNIDEINNKFNKKEKLIKEEFDEFNNVLNKSDLILNLKEDNFHVSASESLCKNKIKEINDSNSNTNENTNKNINPIENINSTSEYKILNSEFDENANKINSNISDNVSEIKNIESNLTFLKKPIRKKISGVSDIDIDIIGSRKYNSNTNSLNSLLISTSKILK